MKKGKDDRSNAIFGKGVDAGYINFHFQAHTIMYEMQRLVPFLTAWVYGRFRRDQWP